VVVKKLIQAKKHRFIIVHEKSGLKSRGRPALAPTQGGAHKNEKKFFLREKKKSERKKESVPRKKRKRREEKQQIKGSKRGERGTRSFSREEGRKRGDWA
jgi:hypothetical protein